ncbi:MAG: ComEC family competence protein [Bacteroidia bacterium]|nr:ComEC family competence protein [Bacteroidia bacterium]
MKAFKTIPFLRILVPFVIGILLAINRPSLSLQSVIWPLVASVLLVISYFLLKDRAGYKWIFFLTADLFLFLFGSHLTFLQNDLYDSTSYTHYLKRDSTNTVLAEINDIPVHKEKFTRFNLKIRGIKDTSGFKSVNGQIYAYVKNGMQTSFLEPGNVILINARFQELNEPQNPFEFDYKSYLFYRNIHHTVFIDSSCFAKVSIESPMNPLWRMALRCKNFVLLSLRNSGLSSEAFSISSALLTGYDDEIDKSVMDSFSHSGTLHVLSVSGLHVGLIYLVFNFLFNRFDPENKHKLKRFLITGFSLWGFALITGFSAPVLRSVIMFSLLGVGKVYFRNQRHNQLNILLVSAFLLLVWNPFFIVDIGFLLSYLALFGLIYFQPALAANWQPANPVLKYLWESTCASFAATISTLPITLFCFKQFPLWFFVCNIVVVPATFVLMLLAMLLLFKVPVISTLINLLIKILVWFISLFNSGTYGYIDNIDFSFSDSVFLSFLIFMFSIGLQYRVYVYLRNAFLLLIFWQIASIYSSYCSKTSVQFAVYKLQKEEGFSVKNGPYVQLSEVGQKNYDFHIKPNLNSFNYPEIKRQNFNYLEKSGRAILLLRGNQSLANIDLQKITTLVLAGNCRIDEGKLEQAKNLKILISGGSNTEKSIAYAEELSRKFKVGFYSVKRSGCYTSDMN